MPPPPVKKRARSCSANRPCAFRRGVQLPAAVTPYVNTIPVERAAALSRRPRDRAAHQEHHPLERHGDGGAGQPHEPRHRRAHLDLRLGRHALRGRLQPFLPRQQREQPPATRSTSRATPRRASTRGRFSRAGSPKTQLENFRRELAPGRRPVVVSAPVADARLLGVPDGLDGPGADHGDLPGALQPLPGGPRPIKHRASRRGLGLPRRRRDATSRRSLGAITLAAREKLDNLIFVINCNLQRLDGPVRGNGKIIQELEGGLPRRRLERHQGDLGRRLGSAAGAGHRRACWCGGWARSSTASTRSTSVEAGRLHPRALLRRRSASCEAMVARPDRRADPRACGAAGTIRRRSTPPTRRPSSTKGAPTVILAKTIKGYGLGEAGEGRNITHQQKKLNEEELREFRDRFDIPISDDEVADAPVLPPAGRQPGDAVPARAARGAGRSRARPRRDCDGDAADAAEWRTSPSSSPAATAARSRRRWPSCGCCAGCCATRSIGTLRRADRARRGAHLRHGGAVPPVRHLLARRAALRAGRSRHAALLPRGEGRPDPRGGHHRGRLDVVVHRRRHGLRHATAST